MIQQFRKLDIFKKVPRDLSHGTNMGGCISILTACLITYFLLSQITLFLDPPLQAHINIDQPLTRRQLSINLQIQFPFLPCELLSLDHQDAMMTHHANIKLNKNGQLIDNSHFQLFDEEDPERQFLIAREAFVKRYGCRIRGNFMVKEVPGNFHISAHPYAHIYRQLLADEVIKDLDVSHKINTLFFGDFKNIDEVQKQHKGSQLNPLKNHHRIYSQAQSLNSHYHIDIVPTVFHGALGSKQTYQYTYYHNTYRIDHMSALYFNYEIGGTRVSISSARGYFSTFLLNLCAVVGGIYAMGNFLLNTLYVIAGTKIGYQELVQ